MVGQGWRAPRAVRKSLGSCGVLGKRPEEEKKEGRRNGVSVCESLEGEKKTCRQ